MRGGFLNTQQTLLNLSGNTAAISTIQTGSTIVGINISGSSKTFENDIPITWEGTFYGQDTSWLSISENQVVTRVGPGDTSARHATIYTLETPSGSLSVDDTEYILVAKSTELGTEVWNEETQTHDIEYTDGFTVGFEKLDGIEFGNEDSTQNHYLIRLKDDNSSFEYVPIIRGFEEVNTENPNLLGRFEIKQIDIEESDLYLINRFIVHNFFGENGDSECAIQYNNSQRCTSPFNYVDLAFHSTAANNVVKIGGVCYSLGNTGLPDGTALCLDNNDYQFFSNCQSCTDSDSSFGPQGPQGAQGSAGFSGSPGGTGPTGAQGAKGNQGATGSTGSQGAAGSTGAKGNTGRTGRTGAVDPDPPSGSMGAKGNTGLTGEEGRSGNKGSTGATGRTGAKGNTGATAADAPQGATGVKGNTGVAGAKGSTGATGAKGNTGAAGAKGSTGATGPQGATGVKGNTGATGADAPQGATGVKGNTGVAGATGSQGNQGAKGNTGPQGNTGNKGSKGNQGNTGAKGNTGVAGAKGSTGAQGAAGNTGAKGNTGPQGNVGPTGPQGNAGPTGPQGNKGQKGAQGDDGEDGSTGPQGNKGQKGAAGGFTTSSDAQVNSLGVGTSASGTTGTIRATNDIIAYYSSDKRLKDVKGVVENALEKVLQLNGVMFSWIAKEGIHENKGYDMGIIAQEVEKFFPEIVVTRENGFKAVKYEKLVAVLIEAIKDLNTKIDNLNK